MRLTKEERYIRRRLRLARRQSRFFYYCRKYPINPRKIVFTTIEGTTGFSCNPKYIALELLRRRSDLDLVWLVDDMTKQFPAGIRKVKNTLRNRAYELSTAAVWVENSRKQLECRKRTGQFYVQTWHASIAIKPIGLNRGKSFSKIAKLVSQHDSNMVDVLLTNSQWVEDDAPIGLLYHGKMIRTGSPRVDILLNEREKYRKRLRTKYNLPDDAKFMIYAPTFRSGSQGTKRGIEVQHQFPDFMRMKHSLENKFGGEWVFLFRLHPQLVARHISGEISADSSCRIIDISQEDDIFESLAGVDAMLTDYSAVAFDAAYMKLPVFLYVYDLQDYIEERGKLRWDLKELPFISAMDDNELNQEIQKFDDGQYQDKLELFLDALNVQEDGQSCIRAVDIIEGNIVCNIT